MTQQQFILLLCGYVIVLIGGSISGKFIQLPDHVRSAKPDEIEIFKRKPKIYSAFFVITGVLILGCAIVGIVGMFFCWHIAPWIFACGVAGKTLMFRSVVCKVKSGLEQMFNDLEYLLDGIILTLVFFGPAKPLFF